MKNNEASVLQEFEIWKDSLDEDQQKEATGFFSVIKRHSDFCLDSSQLITKLLMMYMRFLTLKSTSLLLQKLRIYCIKLGSLVIFMSHYQFTKVFFFIYIHY